MTIAATINRNQFDGDGVTVLFDYTFEINTDDGSDIVLYVVDDDANVTELASNYSVDVANARISYPTVAGVSPLEPLIDALPVGWILVAMRVEPISQTTQLTDQGVFSSSALEGALDKLTMICQQLQEQIDRCVKYPVDQLPSSTDTDAFIAAVSAIIQPPMISGTYAYVKAIAAAAPTTSRMAAVNDQNDAGVDQLFWYCGSESVGDGGWFGPLTGGS